MAKVEERQRAHEIMDLRVVAKKVIDRNRSPESKNSISGSRFVFAKRAVQYVKYAGPRAGDAWPHGG